MTNFKCFYSISTRHTIFHTVVIPEYTVKISLSKVSSRRDPKEGFSLKLAEEVHDLLRRPSLEHSPFAEPVWYSAFLACAFRWEFRYIRSRFSWGCDSQFPSCKTWWERGRVDDSSDAFAPPLIQWRTPPIFFARSIFSSPREVNEVQGGGTFRLKNIIPTI